MNNDGARNAYDTYRSYIPNRMDTFAELSAEYKNAWCHVYRACVNWWKSRIMLPLEKDGDWHGIPVDEDIV